MKPRLDATEVLIIGGGIIGVSAALTLAERGIPVVLCEKGEIGAEQSSRNWGWCRQQGRDPRELPLVIASLARWADMDQRIEEATGFTRCGTLYLAENEQALEDRRAWLVHAQAFDVNAQLIGAQQTQALLPGTSRAWAGALALRIRWSGGTIHGRAGNRPGCATRWGFHSYEHCRAWAGIGWG